MSEKNSGALHSLQLTLARWKAPSAWDVVNRDEPLDPAPPGEWEPSVACNVTSTATITIPPGTAVSTGTGPILITVNYSDLETRAASIMAEEDARVFRAITDAIGLGTRAPGQGGGPSTDFGRGNEPPVEPRLYGMIPYPRNRDERRTFKSIQKNLPKLIATAEQKLGRRNETGSQSKWNDEFWKMVTHLRAHGAEDRRKRRK